jgi:hypothetical protein
MTARKLKWLEKWERLLVFFGILEKGQETYKLYEE